MSSFVGQDLGGGGAVVRDRDAARRALVPAYNNALRRLREGEAEAESAQWRLAQAAADLATGEGSERAVADAERDLDDAERGVRRWAAAVRELDRRRGTVRDSAGNAL